MGINLRLQEEERSRNTIVELCREAARARSELDSLRVESRLNTFAYLAIMTHISIAERSLWITGEVVTWMATVALIDWLVNLWRNRRAK